jgi:RNA polymerase sigma-70 factor (ECF subfamily)
MTSDVSSVELFLAELPERDRIAAGELTSLADLLERAVVEARAAWPTVAQPPERFIRYLAQRLPEGVAIPQALSGMRLADLYLACACSLQIPSAIAAFEAAHLPAVDSALQRMGIPDALRDELAQTLRCQLFIGEGEALPLIADYLGRGDLGSWVRTVATRAALKTLRKERQQAGVGDDEMLAGMASPDDDPVLRHLKEAYAAEFRHALSEALGGLSARERNLARQHFIDGLTIDELAALYKIHRATAARWIIKVRKTILEHTQRLLQERLRLGPSELLSLGRLVRSQLDVSIGRLLAPRSGS